MDLTSHPEMKRKAWAGTSEKDEGELAVAVSGGWVRLIEGDAGVEFAPINIQIDYNLQLGAEVTEGLVFRRQEDGEVIARAVTVTDLRSRTCISRPPRTTQPEYGRLASTAYGIDVLGSWRSLCQRTWMEGAKNPSSLSGQAN